MFEVQAQFGFYSSDTMAKQRQKCILQNKTKLDARTSAGYDRSSPVFLAYFPHQNTTRCAKLFTERLDNIDGSVELFSNSAKPEELEKPNHENEDVNVSVTCQRSCQTKARL